jgi:hypothetical protein
MDALPDKTFVEIDTGNDTPTPATNMAAMLESDTHFDASTVEAATRTSGLV